MYRTYVCHFLRGFWACGRVRGDRSVFVTSHRPVHLSRAHLFSLARIFAFRTEVIFLFDGSACLFLITLLCVSIFNYALIQVIASGVRSGFCVNFTLRLLCSRQRPPPHRLVLRRSRNEPFSVTSCGARPSGRACVSRTSWRTHSCRQQLVQRQPVR